MTELMILVLVVSAIIAGLCVAEQRGDSESAKEIKAICKRQRKEALKTSGSCMENPEGICLPGFVFPA